MVGIGKYKGNYQLPDGTTETGQPTTSSVSKQLQQAIAILTAIRADENIRDDAVDSFLAQTIEGLTKIAEGESVAEMLSNQSSITRQYMYRDDGRSGGSKEVPNPLVYRARG
ncbi:MAG: hypothetical protein CO162_02680 [bacterium (Candidatus Ratteibacteria) CG_4_9_14_3_um_filter_41_21]|uniref:Uncharacterized protein n=1 Tax=bacterium (Candidatus Ratteibacteria) CG_4_9_14_3_um_filter_41_21 TaxID=2014289 RepID=A0A2M7YGM1_9BACT|nr:MAG: hypothetical protein CO162_02680 [bacterium (Candidatus Ratteibacteria) CG_4_9_14_3_um_filter_41_21]